MINEDALIDKAIRMAPIVIGGYLVWKVVTGGLGGVAAAPPPLAGQTATGQWDVEIYDPNLDEWNPWASFNNQDNAQTAVERLGAERGLTARVVAR